MTSPQPSPRTTAQADGRAPIWDVAVVGGGAAGIMAALTARATGASVALVEKEERLGKKILISGGGKCNLTNARVGLENFHGTHPRFVADVLHAFDEQALVAWIQSLGVETVTDPDNGKVWPAAMKSMAVTNALERALSAAGVAILTREHLVAAARTPDGLFELTLRNNPKRGGGTIAEADAEPAERCFSARALVLASGGCAAPQLGADTSGLSVAESFGHKLMPQYPALAGLLTAEKWAHELSGISFEHARVTLEVGGKQVVSANGSLLLTHYGITSPAVFRLSREVGPALEAGEKVRVLVNWRTDAYETEAEARKVMDHSLGANTKKRSNTAVGEIVGAHRLGAPLVALAGGDPTMRVRELQQKDREALLPLLWRCPLTVTGMQGWEKAEVMRGGVDVRKIDPRTMTSKLVPSLFLCGEMLDVDADVGGFNFQFAFASGRAAGSAAAKSAAAQTGRP